MLLRPGARRARARQWERGRAGQQQQRDAGAGAGSAGAGAAYMRDAARPFRGTVKSERVLGTMQRHCAPPLYMNVLAAARDGGGGVWWTSPPPPLPEPNTAPERCLPDDAAPGPAGRHRGERAAARSATPRHTWGANRRDIRRRLLCERPADLTGRRSVTSSAGRPYCGRVRWALTHSNARWLLDAADDSFINPAALVAHLKGAGLGDRGAHLRLWRLRRRAVVAAEPEHRRGHARARGVDRRRRRRGGRAPHLG